MEVHNISDRPVIHNPVVTIGIFDGVHKGHKYILNSLIEKAKEVGGSSVVISLWPHPRIVLNKDVWNLKLLHSQQEKIHHLSKLGLDHYVMIPFDKELASMNACEFVKEYLVNRLHAKRLLIGYDNSFGKDQKGNPGGFAECAMESGMIVEKLDEFRETDSNISSTSVRKALLGGDMESAKSMLDYDYYLEGTVVMGNQLGRKIGFPTANVNPDSGYKLIPKDGVYAVELECEGVFYPAMMNIGIRPTLDSANPVKIIEAHIFDFNKDIYDKGVTIHFRKRLRDEKKFVNMNALKEQLQADELKIRDFFGIKV